jgi:uncharacterized protein YndB with AHSA1/START domain
MKDSLPMKYGALSITRQFNAPRALVYEAWTEIEHRRQWFAGPAWTEIERSVDLRVNGQEIAHGRFPDGTETIYTSRFHLIEPNVRLIYAFDMHVAGKHFSVSLAGVDFADKSAGTELTYTEQGFFLEGDYGAESRTQGTQFLLDQFAAYLETLRGL